MMRKTPILWSIVIAGVALPATAATPGHYPIGAGNVAATISASGMAVSPEQITFLTEVVATKPAPALKLRSVDKIGNAQLSARLECIQSDECLPFFVAIRTGPENVEQAAAISTRYSLQGSAPRAAAVIRSGTTVNLLLEGEHIHIRIPVTCLESGAPGQTIRVQDKSKRVVYTAQVVDASAVRGRLQ
jgi:flagellar basal body P-ring formation chaperone FlgA